MPGVLKLLEQSLKLYQKHFALLAGYMAWLLLPYAALILFSLPVYNVLLTALSTLSFLAQALIGLWLGVLIPLIVFEIISKKTKINLVNLQNKAWMILPSVVFVALLEIAVFLGGLILLIIPAFIFWIWFALAQLAVILDGKKGLAAMSWSRELVRGRFWKSAWRILAVPILVGFTISVGTGFLISLLALGLQVPMTEILNDSPPLWADIISTIIQTFSLPIILIYFTLLYTEMVKTQETKAKLVD